MLDEVGQELHLLDEKVDFRAGDVVLQAPDVIVDEEVLRVEDVVGKGHQKRLFVGHASLCATVRAKLSTGRMEGKFVCFMALWAHIANVSIDNWE